MRYDGKKKTKTKQETEGRDEEGWLSGGITRITGSYQSNQVYVRTDIHTCITGWVSITPQCCNAQNLKSNEDHF